MIQGTRAGSTRVEIIPPGTVLHNEKFDTLSVGPTIVQDGNGGWKLVVPNTLKLDGCEIQRLYASGEVEVQWVTSYRGAEVYADFRAIINNYAKDSLLTAGLNLKHDAWFALAAGDDTEQVMVIDRTGFPAAGFGAITATFGAWFVGGRYLRLKIASGVGVWLEHNCRFIPEGLGSLKSHRGGGPLDGVGMLIESSDPNATGIVLVSGSNARVGGRNPDGGLRMIGGNNVVSCNHGSNFQGVIDDKCAVQGFIGGAANNSGICYETYPGDPAPWGTFPASGHWRCDASSAVIHPVLGLIAGNAAPGIPTPNSDTELRQMIQALTARVGVLEDGVPIAPLPHDTIAVKTDAGGRFQGPRKWVGNLWADKR